MAAEQKQSASIALGHVFFAATDVAAAAQWFETLGLKAIASDPDYALLELRGGTQLVVTSVAYRRRDGATAPFDLMVDDIDAAHRDFIAKGLDPSPIRRDTLHDEFRLVGPDGCAVTVMCATKECRAG
jgi:hypothetical protein